MYIELQKCLIICIRFHLGCARLTGSGRPERLELTGSPEKQNGTAFRTSSVRPQKKGGADRIQNGDQRS